ncbi:MAG TPA: hypothetical protein ENJ20_07430 [Bacteroidetes bacterium]|nr:hypothetical protein [Bacteroidota bacterium]
MVKKAFLYGLKTGLNQWRTALIGYGIQLLLAIVLGLEVYQVLEASIGSSLEINKLMKGFDYPVVTDFIHVHGASLSPLLGQLRYLLLVWFIFSVFINAGLLYAIKEKRQGWNVFWEGGAKYFFKFFKIVVLIFSLSVVWSAAIWVPFISFLFRSPEYLSSEKISLWLLAVVTVIYFLGIIFLFNWSVIARFLLMSDGIKTGQAVRRGCGMAVRQLFPLTILVLLFVLLQALFIAVYWWANGTWGMTSPFLIFIFFIFQQILVFMRWVFKLAIYAGQWAMVWN